MPTISVPVTPTFSEVAEPAVVRLQYLYPDAEFRFNQDANEICIEFEEADGLERSLRKEVHYQLYREKIYKETLPIRTRLYGSG